MTDRFGDTKFVSVRARFAFSQLTILLTNHPVYIHF